MFLCPKQSVAAVAIYYPPSRAWYGKVWSATAIYNRPSSQIYQTTVGEAIAARQADAGI